MKLFFVLRATALAATVSACSTSQNSADTSNGGNTPDGGDLSSPSACNYQSPFTRQPECRDYSSSWSIQQIEEDCSNNAGTLANGCDDSGRQGFCELSTDDGRDYTVVAYGDEDGCGLQETGCETFGGGTWVPAEACGGSGGGGGSGGVFIQPTLECVDPLPGEPAGLSENGKVCTWQAIAGSTEEGRYFPDYASCDVVRTQRPYYPASPADSVGAADPRLSDPEYVAENDWVRSQIEASACVCCHSTEAAPEGTSNWYLEAPNNWVSSMSDTGVALGANAINSVAFGAFPPEDNNGFDRIHSGFPSTDPERMVQFFLDELAYRGKAPDNFASSPPFGGPLYDQIFYDPEACSDGVGIDADGTIHWDGADARYLYVLEADSLSPTVPPNLDLPDKTLWRIDVPSTGTPIASGSVTYGTLQSGYGQKFPLSGAPASLVSGTNYYLYVSLDVGLPVTRCLFQMP